MHYFLQKLSRCCTAKTMFQHVMFGMLAATFSFAAQSQLPTRQPQTNIIAIAWVIAHHHESVLNQQASLHFNLKNHQILDNERSLSVWYDDVIPVTYLTPNNGIRAGPFL